MKTLRKTTHEKRMIKPERIAQSASFFSFHLSLFMLLFLSACEQDINIGGDGDAAAGREIKFDIRFAPQTRVETDLAFNSTWKEGDKIGLFAVKHATDATKNLMAIADSNYLHNVKLTYNNNAWIADSVLQYPEEEDVLLDFYAYYPYDSTASDPTHISFHVSTGQDTTDNHSKSDLLLARDSNVASGAPARLIFRHAMGMVHVKVNLDWPYNPESANYELPMTLYLRHAKPGTIVNLGAAGGSEVTTTGDSAHIKMWCVRQSGNSSDAYIYRALAPAQTFAAGSRLILLSYKDTITLPSDIPEREEFLYQNSPLTAQLNLTAGKVEKYDLTPKWDIDSTYVYTIGEPYPHKGPVQGVVFWLDPTQTPLGVHGKIVSLDQYGSSWGATSFTYATNLTNGLANHDSIETRSGTGWEGNYPAFKWCIEHNRDTTGWYLPAVVELSLLYAVYDANRPRANDILGKLGIPLLDNDSYWSSTETDANTATAVNFANGTPDVSKDKQASCFIRAIKTY
jgi:hypothetical protein